MLDWTKKYFPDVRTRSGTVVAGNLVFLSSMSAVNPETGEVKGSTVEEQVVVILDKIKVAMGVVGSSLDNVIKRAVLLKDAKDYARMREAELKYYRKRAPRLAENPPATTFMQPSSLASPGCLVEIEAIGVLPKNKPGFEVKIYPEHQGRDKFKEMSRSAVVGNLIFPSAGNGWNYKADRVVSNIFEAQMVAALDRIRLAMEEAGSSMDNVIKTIMITKNLEDYPRMRKTELEYYLKYAPLLVADPPASTYIQASSLRSPESLIEIDVVGVISRNKPDWKVTIYPEIRAGKKLSYPNVPAESPKFAKSAVTGNLILLSGCEARNPVNLLTETQVFEEQMLICFDKVKFGLEQAGGSMDNIVKTLVLLTNPKDEPAMRKVEKEYYQKHAPRLVENPPATTFIRVASLARREFLVEIDVTAVI